MKLESIEVQTNEFVQKHKNVLKNNKLKTQYKRQEISKLQKECMKKFREIFPNPFQDGFPETEKIVAIGIFIGGILKIYGASTTQIRKFLDSLRKIEADLNKISTKQDNKGITDEQKQKELDKFIREQSILLKPKLAYAVGRHSDELSPLMEVLNPALTQIKDRESFKKFIHLIETIVAYHRFYGGRDN